METTAPGRGLLDRWRQMPRRTASMTIAVALLLSLLLFSFSWQKCFFAGCPDIGSLAAYQPGGAPVLLDRHGEAFADLAPAQQDIVPLHQLPAHVPQAFLAVEDQHFYEHHGVDWQRFGGAILADLKAGGFSQGFSTITMQLARNLFPERIPGQERTTSRKLLEIRVAEEIEARYSKEEILELYLNHIYFGNRARGIEAAAKQYFGSSARDLTLPQAALLAALPKAPSHYDPRRHPDEARERRDLVLTMMERQGRIPHLEARAARAAPVEVMAAPPETRVESGLAPWFVEQVRHDLEARFGEDLYSRPWRIRTTLDSRAQRAAEEELARQLKRIESGELGTFGAPHYSAVVGQTDGGTSYLQGAIVALDAARGDVLAWVGGRNFAHSQFDRVSQARRQAGSAFKPFVYASALTDGWVLSQPLSDTPLRLKLAGSKDWEPQNFTGKFEGAVTLRDALVRSKNVPTVRLAQAVGLGEVAGLAHRLGIESTVPEVPSAALGAVGVSPLELTDAYTAFARLGTAVEPRFVLDIEDEDGKPVWTAPVERRRDALDPRVAYLITDVLSEALESGTGAVVRRSGLTLPAAGKTGTTNDGADAWFVGYTPEVVAGVWIGFDRPQPILEDASGGRLAAPIWSAFIQRLYAGKGSPKPWAAPKGIEQRAVDPATGLLLTRGCSPRSGEPYRELFLEDVEPASYCPGRDPVPREGFPAAQVLAERRAAQAQEEKLAQKEEPAETPRPISTPIPTLAPTPVERRAEVKEEDKAREERLAQAERELAAREQKVSDEEKRRAALEDEKDKKEPRDKNEEKEATERAEPAQVSAKDTADDLGGWWELSNRIDSTSYDAYQGLRLGYRVQLEQDGDRITGRGQKWSEDGHSLPASARSPITVSGSVDGDRVTLEFTERGAKRSTTGGFSWKLSGDRSTLRGSFWSTAAQTRGSSVARRMP